MFVFLYFEFCPCGETGVASVLGVGRCTLSHLAKAVFYVFTFFVCLYFSICIKYFHISHLWA